jgi:hypothetical protein
MHVFVRGEDFLYFKNIFIFEIHLYKMNLSLMKQKKKPDLSIKKGRFFKIFKNSTSKGKKVRFFAILINEIVF